MELKKPIGFAARGFDDLEAERRRLAAVDRGAKPRIATVYGTKKLVRIGTGQLTPQQERIAEQRRDRRDGIIAKEDEDGQLSGETETNAVPATDAGGTSGPLSGGAEG